MHYFIKNQGEERLEEEERERYKNVIENLKEKRLAYGITQEHLSELAGITRTYLSRIENYSRDAPEKLLEKLNMVLERECSDNPVEIMIDYARIRIPSTDIKMVMEKLLRIKLKYCGHEDFGRYGYPEKYIMGDIEVMVAPDESRGVLIEMKGRGCRQFERYLKAQKRGWFEFFQQIKDTGGIFKRIDLAINDKFGILDIAFLIEKCKRNEVTGRFRGMEFYQSGKMLEHREEREMEMGRTLILGSYSSEIYFCIYEKDYEQYVKKGIPISEAEIKNRFEIRLKNERAGLAVDDLLINRDAGSTAFGIINNYVRFLERGKGKRKNEWKTCKEWEDFIGMERRKLKLTTRAEPYTLDRTLNWMSRQVAPTLKMAMELDNIRGTNIINDMIQNTKLKERQEKILEQQKMSVEDVIVW